MKRFAIQLQFDGTNFAGWQIQPDQRTVQEEIEKSISKILNDKISITGCGRTDAGVHALDYFAHFDTAKNVPENIEHRLNTMVGHEIAIKSVEEVNPEWHARYSALSRSYIYKINLSEDPFLSRFSLLIKDKNLDWNTIKENESIFIGQHDFKHLSKKNEQLSNTICNVMASRWTLNLEDQTCYFEIKANRFLWNMVRRIVGTFILLGKGQLEVSEIMENLTNLRPFDQQLTIPPQGLHLSKIEYERY